MAYPAVEGTPAESSTQPTESTSHSITLPADISNGDLILILFAHGQAVTVNALTGWTELVDDGIVDCGIAVLVRTADGTEGTSVTLTTSGITKSCSIAYRISGATSTDNTLPTISTVATSTNNAPNPGNCDPGVSKEYLWITFFSQKGEEADDDTWCNNAAINYSGLAQKSTTTTGSNNTQIASCHRTNTASSEDASWGSGTTDQTLPWRAHTIAIHPGKARVLTETATITDTFGRAKELTETAVLTDAEVTTQFTGGAGDKTFLGEETAVLTDTIAKNHARTLIEVLLLVGTVLNGTGRGVSDAITLADSVQKGPGRELTSTLTLSEGVTKGTGRTLSSAITLTEGVTKELSREVVETVALTDAINRGKEATYSSVITLSDFVIRGPTRELVETATLADTAWRDTARILTESASLADSFSSSYGQAGGRNPVPMGFVVE